MFNNGYEENYESAYGLQGGVGRTIHHELFLDDSTEPSTSRQDTHQINFNESDEDDPSAEVKMKFNARDKARVVRNNRSLFPIKKKYQGTFQHMPDNCKEADYVSLLAELKKMYGQKAKKIKTDDPPALGISPPTPYVLELNKFIEELASWPAFPLSSDFDNLRTRDQRNPKTVAWKMLSHRLPTFSGPDPPSLMLNMDFFPPEINPERLILKPVYIDGCAVAQLYNPSYCTYFHSRTSDLPWTKLHILNVTPLIMVSTHFLLRGHKVTIFLPRYYEQIYYRGFRSMCKVDDPYKFEVLRSLGLLKFIEMTSSPVKFIDEVLREEVKKVNACLISSPNVERMYRQIRQYIWEDDDDTRTMDNQEECPIDTSSKADDGMITPHFFGVNKLLVVHIGCTYFKGDDITKHEDRKFHYDSIVHEQILFYPNEIENHSEHYAHAHQLTMKEQIRTLLKLANLQSHTAKELTAIKSILAVGRHNAPWEMIREFFSEYELERAELEAKLAVPTIEETAESEAESAREEFEVGRHNASWELIREPYSEGEGGQTELKPQIAVPTSGEIREDSEEEIDEDQPLDFDF